MNNLFLIKRFLIALSILLFISCDTDFNDLGANIVDGDLHNGILRTESNVVAYDRPTGAVQANNLDVNILGVFDNPVFGQTKAHYVTQVQLAATNPTFGTNIHLDSVYLYVPYYSTVKTTDSDGNSTYKLDSIYGNADASYRLRIRENGYFLRDSDPATETSSAQKYYSNDKVLIDGQVLGSVLEDGAEYADVRFDRSQITRTANYTNDENVVTPVDAEKLAPGLFLYLKKDFFQQKILDQATTGKLANNSIFKEYFRGLYFTVEQLAGQSVMGAAKFKEGKITIKYTEDVTTTVTTNGIDTITITPTKRTMVLNLTGNTINFFENTPNPVYAAAVATSNTTVGDEKIYIKGGEGSMAFIDLDSVWLNAKKPRNNGGEKILINEANLVFYVDQDAMLTVTEEPPRVFLYDVNNKRPLYDYYTDGSANNTYPKYGKYIHGGLLEVDSVGNSASRKGLRYKIRITDHINNLINKDSTHVRLGLVVTESISLTGNAALKVPFTIGDQVIETLPVSSVIHPFGTVLYGTGPSVPTDKRVKLEIYYTKPNY